MKQAGNECHLSRTANRQVLTRVRTFARLRSSWELVQDLVGQLDRQVEMHAQLVLGQNVSPRHTESWVPARFEDIHALEETDVTLKSLKLVT